MNNGKETNLKETFVRKYFADELMSSKRGFVDIPVGDNKPSFLHNFPHLKVPGSPPVKYCQSDGKNLCGLKLLVSAIVMILA